MFPMNPTTSWLLMIVLALIIAAPLTAMYLHQRRLAERAAAAQERLAPVIELRPRPVPTNHKLAIVPELRDVEEARKVARIRTLPRTSKPSQSIYDWQTQGI
ncbi:hypothetical protein ACFVU2_19180 [Leifsonia sp. NPDC058194]|uniref:hypothetical protein n=1 Tax=Leifsonia sp. NPDC058194 TaxID=3346374 RepID=UPI0036D8567C